MDGPENTDGQEIQLPLGRFQDFINPDRKREEFNAVNDPEAYDSVMNQRALAGVAFLGEAMAKLPKETFSEDDPYKTLDILVKAFPTKEAVTVQKLFPDKDLLRVSVDAAKKFADVERAITQLELDRKTIDAKAFRSKLDEIYVAREDLNGRQIKLVVTALDRSKGIFGRDHGRRDDFANQFNNIAKSSYGKDPALSETPKV